jgi:hypothetical protein
MLWYPGWILERRAIVLGLNLKAIPIDVNTTLCVATHMPAATRDGAAMLGKEADSPLKLWIGYDKQESEVCDFKFWICIFKEERE